ncbi:MAG: type II toxin-antitoxin system RelE/ParE family toxin [Pedobacter sp.]|nr:MAG: type II toxin-antitoxin system RelE/ParE family toxin [Pedobacter sp.]
MNVVWSEEASNSLTNIYFYILEDSPQNAEMVIEKIIELAEKLQNESFEYQLVFLSQPLLDKICFTAFKELL